MDQLWHVSLLPVHLPTDEDRLKLPAFDTEEEAVAAAAEALSSAGPSVRYVWTSGQSDVSQEEFTASTDTAREQPAPTNPVCVVYFARSTADIDSDSADDLASLSKQDVTLTDHTRRIVEIASEMSTKLGLPPDLRDAVVLAAEGHDLGKNRALWQLAIGNAQTTAPLAKSHRYSFDRSITQGYRHEFGSLVEVLNRMADGSDPVLRDHPRRELILHLIAAHHGYARPSFAVATDPDSLPSQTSSIARDVALRFDRLQGELGHWQLAWLESLVKCADALASAFPHSRSNSSQS